MARYQVVLAYDGTSFLGFQRQANSRTVQGIFEKALRQLGWTGRSILSAGRTDTGVHAAGQVVAFDLNWQHTPLDLCNALNAHLPPDAAAQRVLEVSGDFHPRYAAKARRYWYQVITAPQRDPLRERFAWRVWPAPDLEQLQSAASSLPGSHDFAAFGSPPKKGGSTRREILKAVWNKAGDMLWFDVVGNAFLFHMVRRLVAFQMAVGQKKLPPQALSEQLHTPGDTSAVGLAPACGLCLGAVYYTESYRDENYLDDGFYNRN